MFLLSKKTMLLCVFLFCVNSVVATENFFALNGYKTKINFGYGSKGKFYGFNPAKELSIDPANAVKIGKSNILEIQKSGANGANIIFCEKSSNRWKYIDNKSFSDLMKNDTVILGLKSAKGIKSTTMGASIEAKNGEDYDVLFLGDKLAKGDYENLISRIRDIFAFSESGIIDNPESYQMYAACNEFVSKYGNIAKKESKIIEIINKLKKQIYYAVKKKDVLNLISPLLEGNGAYALLNIPDFSESEKVQEVMGNIKTNEQKNAVTVLMNEKIKTIYDEALKIKKNKEKSLVLINSL